MYCKSIDIFVFHFLDATEDFIAERYEYNQDLRKYQSEAKEWEPARDTNLWG